MKIFVMDKYGFCFILCLLLITSIFFISCLSPSATDDRLLPIYSVETDEKVLAITFDSAWTAEDLPNICNTLDEYNCKATFFVVGSWAEKYPESVKMLAERGHEIAGHSYNHAHYNNLSHDELISDMDKCDRVIYDLIGKNTRIFRSPYGEYNNTVVNAAKESGRVLIQWDVDSLDWKDLSCEEMLKRITPNVKNGSIILLHNGTKYTASSLPVILKTLTQNGYSFKTVGDLIYKENYVINQEGRQIKD